MPILATNTVRGEFGVPGAGVFRGGETREVSLETAAYLSTRPEFRLNYGADDVVFRGPDGKPKYLGLFGPVSARFGYGGASIDILQALSILGVHVRVSPHYNGTHDTVDTVDLPPRASAQAQYRNWLPQWELCHCLPTDMRRSRAPRKIAWTMWETDHLPQDDLTLSGVDFGHWPNAINEHAEQVIVPCRHNAEVFRQNGIDRPITVIPYGLDTDIWPYIERPERDSFTVVLFGDLTVRKAPFEALLAFQKAFPTEQNVRLVFKTHANHLGLTSRIPIIPDKRVTVINAMWSRAELLRLLQHADCMLWLSRGEGFGLPVVQALLTGLPVVTTTHTGMAEWFRADIAEGVCTAGMSDSPLGGQWYEPDIDHAAEQLRKVYENRKAALRKAKRGAGWLRKQFGLEAFAQRLGAFLETL